MAWTKNTDPEKIKEYNKNYYEKKRKAKLEEARKNKAKPTYVKICPICSKEFTTIIKKTKYCSAECKEIAKKEREKEYRQTDKFKNYMKEYTKTDKYKAIKKEYSKTQAFKDSVKKYNEKKKLEKQSL